MNKEELRAVRKDRLRSGPEEGSKGGELGLMEIARRASKPIEFDLFWSGGQIVVLNWCRGSVFLQHPRQPQGGSHAILSHAVRL
jgi:hypothetical protein